VHAKTVKNTENTDGQKNEIQRKNKENNYIRPKFGTKKKLYFENTGTEGSVFYCIFSNTTGKCLYWHAQNKTKITSIVAKNIHFYCDVLYDFRRFCVRVLWHYRHVMAYKYVMTVLKYERHEINWGVLSAQIISFVALPFFISLGFASQFHSIYLHHHSCFCV
jgi:hypothetical protein